MATLGGQLKAAREAKGVTLSEAAAVTHIKVQHLDGIEVEDFGRIASPVYVKGFLRIYARYLGQDPEPLIREYTERFLPRAPDPVPGADTTPAPWWKQWGGGKAAAPHRAPPSAMTPRKQMSPHAAVVSGDEIPSMPPPEVQAPAWLPPRKGEETKSTAAPVPAPAPVAPPPPPAPVVETPIAPRVAVRIEEPPASVPGMLPLPDASEGLDLFSQSWTAPVVPAVRPPPPGAVTSTLEPPPPAVRPPPSETSIFPRPVRQAPTPAEVENEAEREISPDLAIRAVRWMAGVAVVVICLMLVRCAAGFRDQPKPPQVPQVPSFRVPGLVDEPAEPYLPGEPALPRRHP